MQTKTFHSDFQAITVCVGGTPISINAEVEITIKEPAKQDAQSRQGWDTIKRNGADSVTCHVVPAAKA